MKYRFPGILRELKNITVQMSVLEIERNIDLETVKKYIPESNNLPALSNTNLDSDDENYNERDILYKILFDLKNDVTEMKKIIDNILNTNDNVHLESKDTELIEEMSPEIKRLNNVISGTEASAPVNEAAERHETDIQFLHKPDLTYCKKRVAPLRR